MPSPRADRSRLAVGWFFPAALLALAPKCLLCVAAYAGLGAALGLGAPEICGASAGLEFSWSGALAVVGTALAATGIFVSFTRRHVRTSGER
jgi:hypothetical protein